MNKNLAIRGHQTRGKEVIELLEMLGGKNLRFYKEEPKEEPKRKYAELRMDSSDDDKLATEVLWDNCLILPPVGYLVGKITEVDDGLLVEFVKKRPQEDDCIDLTEILKNVPKGTILYSPIYGNIRFDGVFYDEPLYPIGCHNIHGSEISFTKDGRWDANSQGECVLFPSSEQRDWSKFELKTEK